MIRNFWVIFLKNYEYNILEISLYINFLQNYGLVRVGQFDDRGIIRGR